MLNSGTGRFSIAVLILVIDQLVKLWATSTLDYITPVPITALLNLTLVHNTGAAFSFLADAGGWQRWFFIVLSLAISLLLIVWITRLTALQKMLGTGLASQPSLQEAGPVLDEMIDALIARCDQVECDAERTRAIVKATCAAVLSSGGVLID